MCVWITFLFAFLLSLSLSLSLFQCSSFAKQLASKLKTIAPSTLLLLVRFHWYKIVAHLTNVVQGLKYPDWGMNNGLWDGIHSSDGIPIVWVWVGQDAFLPCYAMLCRGYEQCPGYFFCFIFCKKGCLKSAALFWVFVCFGSEAWTQTVGAQAVQQPLMVLASKSCGLSAFWKR